MELVYTRMACDLVYIAYDLVYMAYDFLTIWGDYKHLIKTFSGCI